MSLTRIIHGVFIGFLLVILGYSSFAKAETIPATSTPNQSVAICGTSAPASTIDGACTGAGGTLNTSNGYCYGVGQCRWDFATVYSCPSGQNWTLSGSSCTRPDCSSPSVRGSDGVCFVDCSGKSGKDAGWYGGEGSSSATTVNNNGCKVSCDTGVAMGNQWASTGCKYTGEAAPPGGTDTPQQPAETPEKAPTPSPSSCLGQGDGYITGSSGTTTCLPSGSVPASTPVTKTTNKAATTTTTTPAGTETTTTKTTDTISSSGGGSSVTRTTEKSTTPAGGGASVTTTESETADQGTFCEKYPSSAVCKKAESECDKNPELLSCKELGDPGTEPTVESKVAGVSSISVVSFGSNASCPGDIQLPRGASLSFEWPCNLATTLKPIILALAWLSAGLIVMGAFRNS